MKRTLYITILLSLFLLVISCDFHKLKKYNEAQPKIDSISTLIQQSEDYSLEEKTRKDLLKKAYKLNTTLKSDSLKRHLLLDMIRSAVEIKGSSPFEEFSSEAYSKSIKAKDTLGLAKIHYYFGRRHSQLMEEKDNAYYHFNLALEYNISLDRKLNIANSLISIAILLKNSENYYASENFIFQALKIYIDLNESYGLYTCYSLLGEIYIILNDYEEALRYDLRVKEVIDQKSLTKGYSNHYSRTANLGAYSSMGTTYYYMGNYEKAHGYYAKVLKFKNIKHYDIKMYADALQGFYLTKFRMGDTLNVIKNLNIALRINDSLEHKPSMADIRLDIADCYTYKLDTLQALIYSREAYQLASKFNDNENHLKSLKRLARLDKKNASIYLKEYIKLNDSIQKNETKVRNKFSRIQFETNEYIEKKEKLSLQNTTIVGVVTTALIILGLLYFIRIQRTKSKKLLFEKGQQNNNDEIYNLILKQQSYMEEGRLKERHRIAEELHNSIIGRIFGTRLSFDSLNFKGGEEDSKKLNLLLKELQDIEKEVRDLSYELKNNWLNKHQNFNKLIELLLEKYNSLKLTKYELFIDKEIDWDTIDGTIKTNLFRIVQETIQNCHKHANASKVEIRFLEKKKTLILVVKDNGSGFIETKRKGIGLKNIDSRVKHLKGVFEIQSETRIGTILRVTIPKNHQTTL